MDRFLKMLFETLVEKNLLVLLPYYKPCKRRNYKVIRFCKIEMKFSTKVYTKWRKEVFEYNAVNV